MNNDPMLDFVKAKLEENEGVSPETLTRLLAAAGQSTRNRQPETRNQKLAPTLLAASLAIAACGWFFHANSANARRESNLTNIIDLLRMADGDDTTASDSLSEQLLAWQDAPTLVSDGE